MQVLGLSDRTLGGAQETDSGLGRPRDPPA